MNNEHIEQFNQENKMDETIKELLLMKDEDQEALKNGSFDSNLSQKHVESLRQIISQIGWPTISKVGKEASFAAWLIAQHADHDREFQADCLKSMKENVGDITKRNIAYLEDRVLVANHQPQLYGTQFYVDEQGNYGPRPIEEPEKLEERWKDMELGGDLWGTFEEYKEYLLKNYKEKRD